MKDIDASMKKHNYSTKTDFVREAVREHLKKLENEVLLKDLLMKKPKSISDDALEKVKEQVLKEFAKEKGWI